MPTVGEILRSEREKQGLSIKDIEKATSIRTLYLSSIEADNYSVIPGEVYLKGFIRNYANCLGLDAKELLELYRQTSNLTDLEPEKTSDDCERTAVTPVSDRVGGSSKTNKLIVVGLVSVFLIGILSWAIGNRNNQPPQQLPDPKPAPTSPAVPVPQSSPNTLVPEKPAPQSKPIMVTAKYTDLCWTLVIADGKEVYEGTPKIGETLQWEAQSNLSVQLGNASGVEIIHNGQAIGKMGEKGEVLKKTFTAAAKP
ncbi:Cytoskeleton protein RodZ [bioreactor metagenome]|uniref:Cytoskeleton protein RodZ n=1 Tax=bioreactor metagenome TaxID=1076179 RepID=A0A644T308_9ZZZZ